MNNNKETNSTSELEELKDKYSRLERAYNTLKDDAAKGNGKTT